MKYLTYEKLEHIGLLKICRKEVLNALNRDLLEEMYMLLELLAKGQQLRALIITGDGDEAFSSGADIKEMQTMSPLEMVRFSELGQKVAKTLQNSPFLTIAAVNGYALGGGFEMALAADFIYASEESIFGLPEVTLGFISSFGGTQRLTEAVGLRQAKELIMSGESIAATEALRLNIVNKIFSEDALLPNCYQTATNILKNPFPAVLQAKKAVNSASCLKENGFHAESNMSAICFTTSERLAKMEAFINHKKEAST